MQKERHKIEGHGNHLGGQDGGLDHSSSHRVGRTYHSLDTICWSDVLTVWICVRERKATRMDTRFWARAREGWNFIYQNEESFKKKQVLKDGFRKLGVQTHRLVMFEQQFRHPNGGIKWVNECTGMDLWLGISTWSCHSMVLKATKIKQDLQGCRIDRTEKRAIFYEFILLPIHEYVESDICLRTFAGVLLCQRLKAIKIHW